MSVLEVTPTAAVYVFDGDTIEQIECLLDCALDDLRAGVVTGSTQTFIERAREQLRA